MRIGRGYNVHHLVGGRKFMLGDIGISYKKGLPGHSNTGVLLHAISDALPGAAVLGDVGAHFPDSDPAYSGVGSAELLRMVGNLIYATGYEIGDTDSTVVCQAPELAPRIGAMRAQIVEVFALPMGAVNVKMSNEEHVGLTGRGEGTATHAVYLLTERTK